MLRRSAFISTPLTLIQPKQLKRRTSSNREPSKRTPVLCHPVLQRAIAEKKLDDIGRTVHLNSDGTLCSPLLCETNIPPFWKDALNCAVDLFVQQLGDSLHSLYLRGSVAAGHAYADGRSDLDFIALSTSRATPPQLRQFPFVRRVDVSYYDPDVLPSNVRFILLAYCVHVHGVDVRPSLGCIRPSTHLLMNIRADLQLAIDHQWFLKRALRALVDALGPELCLHARDVVPCARILVEARPQYAEIAARAAVATASSEPNEALARDIADWADTEYIAIRCGRQSFNFRMAPPAPAPSMGRVLQALISDNLFAVQGLLTLFRNPASHHLLKSNRPFIRDEFRDIALSNTKPVREVRGACLSSIFVDGMDLSEPVIYRDALARDTRYLRDCTALIRDLSSTFHPADVRVSDRPEFTFCRMNHGWTGFVAPSTLVRMSPREFLQRACDSTTRVYMQTEVSPSERLFPIEAGVAQRERRWMCTHGAVSTLHYDAAHSALAVLTGAKRMVFFPPQALPRMGVYTEGHPLARRAMLDLSRPDAALFGDFWHFDANTALETWIRPGDVVVFPAFWSHYTESHSEKDELCAAHTIRWVGKVGGQIGTMPCFGV